MQALPKYSFKSLSRLHTFNNNCYWTHTSLVVFTLNFKTSNSLTTLLSSSFNLRRWTLHLLDTFYWGSLCEGVYKFFYRLVSTMDPPKVFRLRKILLIRSNIERLFFTLPCVFWHSFLASWIWSTYRDMELVIYDLWMLNSNYCMCCLCS